MSIYLWSHAIDLCRTDMGIPKILKIRAIHRFDLIWLYGTSMCYLFHDKIHGNTTQIAHFKYFGTVYMMNSMDHPRFKILELVWISNNGQLVSAIRDISVKYQQYWQYHY